MSSIESTYTLFERTTFLDLLLSLTNTDSINIETPKCFLTYSDLVIMALATPEPTIPRPNKATLICLFI